MTCRVTENVTGRNGARLGRRDAARASAKAPVDVEIFLQWVYRDQKAARIVDHGVGLLPAEAVAAGVCVSTPDSAEIVARNMVLGCTILGSGKASGDLHPDAERAHGVVRRLGGRAAELLVLHGCAATRPDWCEEGVGFHPVYNLRGRPAMLYDDHRNAIGCRVREVNPPAWVAMARRDYAVWHGGLVAVAESLAGDSLKTWRVRLPLVSRKPWEY